MRGLLSEWYVIRCHEVFKRRLSTVAICALDEKPTFKATAIQKQWESFSAKALI